MTKESSEAASSGPTKDEQTETDNLAGGSSYPFELEPEDYEEIGDNHGRLTLESLRCGFERRIRARLEERRAAGYPAEAIETLVESYREEARIWFDDEARLEDALEAVDEIEANVLAEASE